MARSMTFQINDASTGGTNPAVFITITENADGTLSFNVSQAAGGIIGDLRGLFFDVNAVADGALASSLSISAASAVSTLTTGNDSITNLGNGSNMNGLTSSNGDGGFDGGINIGSAGIGSDDIRSFSFTMGSSTRGLTLDDFANVDFGVRLTSVGTLGGTRSDSSKLLETTSAAINANNDTGTVNEDNTANGNLLTNDANTLAVTTVTGWTGGDLGAAVLLDNAEGTTLTVNADGTWALNAVDADALSEGEVLTYHFSYNAQSSSADQTSSDSAGFTVTVVGVNDGPVAGDDAASTAENDSAATGSVLDNDDDVDRLDTISVASWDGGALGNTVEIDNGAGATFQLNADGSYTLDASTADELSEGETITQQFSYTLADDHNGSDTATIDVTVTGVNDGPVAGDDEAGPILESGSLSGDVTGNDTDVDRLDDHTWALVADSFNGSGNLAFNDDGTWSYDTAGAYDGLMDGEYADLSFTYAMTDNHDSSDEAVVSFRVNGVGTATGGGDTGGGDTGGGDTGGGTAPDDFPLWGQDISHVTLVFRQTAGDTKPNYKGDTPDGDGYYTVKIDVPESFNDDLDSSIGAILAKLDIKDANITSTSDLLGVVIKGGQQDTKFYAYGDYNENDTASDPLPEGIGFSLSGNDTENPANAIDVGYTYEYLFA